MDILRSESLKGENPAMLHLCRSSGADFYWRLGLLEQAPGAKPPRMISVRNQPGVTVLKTWEKCGKAYLNQAKIKTFGEGKYGKHALSEANSLFDFLIQQQIESCFFYVKTGFIANYGTYHQLGRVMKR